MKKILYTLLITMLSLNVFAQNIGDLNGIYYQAVAIDENGKEIVGMDVEGKPLFNKTIGVRFTITGGLNGPVQWEETHATTTDKYGLFNLIIGQGQLTGTAYNHMLEIPWIDANQFLKVEISTTNNGNYKLVSNQKFMAVPYSFYTDDIADDAITSAKILNYAVQNEDLSTGSIDSRTILDQTIVSQDIATGAVDSRTILDGSIVNADIANSTIDLTTKVTGILAVENGGTGGVNLSDGGLLIGGGTEPVRSLPRAKDGQIAIGVTDSDPILKKITAGMGIQIIHSTDSILITSTISGGVESDGTQTLDIGTIAAGSTYTSPAFPVPGDGSGQMGDIILASIDKNLQGCMLTPYFFSSQTIKVAIFNGTGTPVNLGTGVKVKLLIVK
jgi:hypothetical protein